MTDAALEAAKRDLDASPRPVPVAPAKVSNLLTQAYARRMVQTWSMWFLSNFAANSFSVCLPIVYSSYYRIQLTRTLQYTFIIAGTSVVGRIFAYAPIDKVGRKAPIVGMIIGPTTSDWVWLLMGGAQRLSAGLSLWLARETSGRNLVAAAATA